MKPAIRKVIRQVAVWCFLALCVPLQGVDVPTGVQLSENQTLTRTLRGDPESLDPHLASGIPGAHVMREMFEGLVTQDANGQIVPGQAEHWEVSEDGKTWTFYLRDHLKWSDGTELSAFDFEYSFRRLASPKTGAFYGWFPEIMGIEDAGEVMRGEKPVTALGVQALSKKKFVIRLDAPLAYLLPMLTHRSMHPVPEHTVEAYGRDWMTEGRAVSNGPYTLSRRVIHERIQLNRNSYYWNNDKTVITQITFLPVESETAGLSRYRANEVEIMDRVPSTHRKTLVEDYPNELKTQLTLSTYYLTFNTRKKPFDDVRVRKALSYAIQRERITEDVLGQGQIAAYTFTPEIVSDFTPPTPAYKSVPLGERQAEAKRLLAAAGYHYRNPLEVTYIYNGTDENRRIAVAIQKMWQGALPVKVKLESQEWGTYLQNKAQGRYQVARALWAGDHDEPSTMLNMHTPQHSNNSSFYNNEKYNQLLLQARSTLDAGERNQLYGEAELLLAEYMPVAPIYWDSSTYLIKSNLRGVSYRIPQGRIYAREIYRVK